MTRAAVFITTTLALMLAQPLRADDTAKKMKVFVLAGQSNMVGWGNSLELPKELRRGNDRVLMFEGGKWQPLRPFKKAQKSQERFGMTEFTFGPEISFGHTLAEAWPEETIGIVKFAIGGSSILTWRPDWTKKDARRVGQERMGSLYNALMSKVRQASKSRDIEIVGFLWLQGGKDMRHVDVGKEYLAHLKNLVADARKRTGVDDLMFLCGSPRRTQDPDDISDTVPQPVEGPYPAVEFVLKAHWEIQKEVPNARTVILRDIEVHPKNVHYNTAGQLKVGKLFTQAFLEEANPGQ